MHVTVGGRARVLLVVERTHISHGGCLEIVLFFIMFFDCLHFLVVSLSPFWLPPFFDRRIFREVT